ncbi:MAG: ABC transporter ATP-binding protein [Atribacterota bacterium]
MNGIMGNVKPFLEFKDVSKIYPTGVRALEGVNLALGEGEFVFLFGPSGAGKTTLLKLINREERPTRGEVWLSGCRISHLEERYVPLLRQNLGMIFQDLHLVPEWTVLENLLVPLEVLQVKRNKAFRMAKEMLRFLRLEKKGLHRVEWLSGGERQKLSLGRALIHQPGLVLADEPTKNLDEESAQEVVGILFEFVQKTKATVILATHDQELLQVFGGRVVRLERGKVSAS